MGGVSKAFKKMGLLPHDPGTMLVKAGAESITKNNPNNGVTNFLLPGARVQNRKDAGEATTLGEVGDPGSFFNESPEDKAKRLQEEAQARLNATPPTLTSANIASRQQADRLKRRQGVLANIYGGSSGGPLVGTKMLLGQ